MLKIEFSASDVARIRFGFSMLWEIMASLRVLRDPSDHAIHLPWVTRVRPRLAGHEFPLLRGLIPGSNTYMPDFLTPAPTTLIPELEHELAVLLATPHDVVRKDIGKLEAVWTPEVQAMYDDPAAGLERLVAEIREYWSLALAQYWPRIRALLESEVFYRARRLAEDGAGGLLNDLHQRVRWEGDTLSIAHKFCSGNTVLDGVGLLLVPSVFVWPSVLSVADPEQPQLAYPARAIATLWECGEVVPEALAAVIGKTRAQLLAALESPVSTTELARRTGLSAGGISQHLGALRAAGLVIAQRSGHAVLNTRTPVADSLLSLSGV